MTGFSARQKTRVVLALATIGLAVWLAAQNTVPFGTFIVVKAVNQLSPWAKNFWPPTAVYPPERSSNGQWFQRIVISPVTLRVQTPRVFRVVTVLMDADGIPPGSTVGVATTLKGTAYVTAALAPTGATLSLADVDQRERMLQFAFTFPDLVRAHPVVAHTVRFAFSR